MEDQQRTSKPEDREQLVVSISRSAIYVIVTAVVFFIVGYGIAWFSFNAAISAREQGLEETVRTAVSAAFADLDLPREAAQVAAPQAPAAPQIVNVSVGNSPSRGPEDAPITIVEFSDFRCGFCGRFQAQTLQPLLDQYGDQIRFVYRNFPVVGGERAAEAAQCVFAQSEEAFWAYHDLLFANQQTTGSDDTLIALAGQVEGLDVDAFQECLSADTYVAAVQADFADGISYGVSGTPTFFINGRLLVGAQPLTAFQAIINEALAAQNEQPS